MNAQTKLSANGQVVIPWDVRRSLGLNVGDKFDLVVEDGRIVLERRDNYDPVKARMAVADLNVWLDENFRYDGPYITDEMIQEACQNQAAEEDRRVTKGE